MPAPAFHPLPSYLPVSNPTVSYWRRKPHRLEHHRSTPDLPASCDTLIIGTGLTGVSTAYHLLNHPSFDSSVTPNGSGLPSASPAILLLEARTSCSGATGRNGGHLKPAFMNLANNRTSLGADAAAAVAHFEEAQIAALEEVVEREGIDCEFRKGRSWDAFLDSPRAEETFELTKKWEQEGWSGISGMSAWNDHAEGKGAVEERCQVRGARTVVESPAAMLWPYKFTMRLLERVLEKGAQLQTETPVVELLTANEDDLRNGWKLLARTPRGDVRCRRVIVATNAYTAGLLREYEGVIRPVKGANSLMENQDRQGDSHPALKNSFNVHHGPSLANYIVPQPSGSWIVGGAFEGHLEHAEERYDNIDDSTLLPRSADSEQAWSLKSVLPKWIKGCEDMSEGEVWSGIMGYTPDLHPHIGKVPGREDVYIAAGFCGRGMVIIFLATKGLAQIILEGGDIDKTDLPACFAAQRGYSKKWA